MNQEITSLTLRISAGSTHATNYAQRILIDMADRLDWASQRRGRRGLTPKQRAFAARLMAEIAERAQAQADDPRPKDDEGNIIIDPNARGWEPSHPILGAAQRIWMAQHGLPTGQRFPDTLRSIEESARAYLQGDDLTAYVADLKCSWGGADVSALLGVDMERALAKGWVTSRKQVQALLSAIPGVWTVTRVGRWYDNSFGSSRPIALSYRDHRLSLWSSKEFTKGEKLIITKAAVKTWGIGSWVSKGKSYPNATKVRVRGENIHRVNNNNNEE
jgi:hypothetical protein